MYTCTCMYSYLHNTHVHVHDKFVCTYKCTSDICFLNFVVEEDTGRKENEVWIMLRRFLLRRSHHLVSLDIEVNICTCSYDEINFVGRGGSCLTPLRQIITCKCFTIGT